MSLVFRPLLPPFDATPISIYSIVSIIDGKPSLGVSPNPNSKTVVLARYMLIDLATFQPIGHYFLIDGRSWCFIGSISMESIMDLYAVHGIDCFDEMIDTAIKLTNGECAAGRFCPDPDLIDAAMRDWAARFNPSE